MEGIPAVSRLRECYCKATAKIWDNSYPVRSRVAFQCGGKPERQHNAGGRIASTGAHHSEAGQSAFDGDQHKDTSSVRSVSLHSRTGTKNGSNRAAHLVLSAS